MATCPLRVCRWPSFSQEAGSQPRPVPGPRGWAERRARPRECFWLQSGPWAQDGWAWPAVDAGRPEGGSCTPRFQAEHLT